MLIAAAALSACHTGEQCAQPGTATFGYFDYRGADDIYAANPLPTPGCFYNPVLPGWYSDPTICTNGQGDYWLATSTFTYFPGVPLFHSTDLVNWRQVGHVLTRESQLQNMQGQPTSGGIFAPDLKYCPWNGTYYMVTTNVGLGNFYVKATDPAGEWSEPVRLPQVGGIDPSFFFDTDGRAYIVNNDDAPDGKPEYDGHRTIRIREIDLTTDSIVGEEKILVNKGARPQDNPIWIEGPHMYRIGEWYYLMDAEGGTGGWHSEVVFRGKSPWGPFEPWEGNPILTQRHLPDRPYPITCAGHADLVQTTDGDWWSVFLACRPINNDFENLGRETFMMPVQWTADGWPYMTQGQDVVPLVLNKEGATRDTIVTFGNFDRHESFDGTQLPQEWMTMRAPGDSLWAMGGGCLTLTCSTVKASDRGTPACVLRRVQHHTYEAETEVTLNATASGQQAGVIVYKDDDHFYFMALGTGRVTLWRSEAKGELTSLAADTIDGKVTKVLMKVVSLGQTLDFMYSADGGKAWQTLASGVPARYLSTAATGGFTGTVIGLYAVDEPCE